MEAQELYGIKFYLPAPYGGVELEISDKDRIGRQEVCILGSRVQVGAFLHDLKKIVDEAIAKTNECATR